MMQHEVATPASCSSNRPNGLAWRTLKASPECVLPQAPISGPVRPPEGPQVEYDSPEGQFTFRGEDVTHRNSSLCVKRHNTVRF